MAIRWKKEDGNREPDHTELDRGHGIRMLDYLPL
jgi:hypothetical protein